MNKVIKLALQLKEQECFKYKDLCNELWEMQYLTAKACNRVMTLLYADVQQDFILKETGMQIPSPKELYGKTRMTYLYDIMKQTMETSHSSIVSQTRALVEQQFSKDVKKGLLKGNVSLTNFKRDAAIQLSNRSYILYEDSKGINVEISLFNREKAKALGLKNGKICFVIPRLNPGEKAVLYRIMDKEYKQCTAALSYNQKKKKWMLGVGYSFKSEDAKGENILKVRLDEEVLMHLLAVSGNETVKIHMKPYDKIVPGLQELESFQKKMYALRKAYGNATRIASDNNCGKGYRKRAEKLLQLEDKEKRFRDTFNHKISRYVVDIAERYDCGLIELEDFSKVENPAFKSWAYFDLQQKIVYKAEEKGISITIKLKEENPDV